MKEYQDKYAEVATDYYCEEDKCWYVDGWQINPETGEQVEEGEVIGTVHSETLEVKIKRPEALSSILVVESLLNLMKDLRDGKRK